jgi:hypothetical protein
MTSLYWLCLLVGGGVVVLQFGASILGLHHDAPHHAFGHGELNEGLQLFSVRSVAAGIAFFGVGALALQAFGMPASVAAVGGVATGGVAAVGVALLMRSMLRLESDRSFRLAETVGNSGDVYLSIPARRQGTGKIHITLQGRLMELDAMTPDDAIATGAQVLVIDTIAPSTVIVALQPRILEQGDGDA